MVEWLDGWIRGTEELLEHVEYLKNLAEQCETVEEFKRKAKYYIEKVSWFKDKLNGIIESAVNDNL